MPGLYRNQRNCKRFHWNVLAILYARGILIGVISKNDPYLEADIKAFIKEHLAGTEFVCFKLNWKDKWENFLEVQQQIKPFPKWFPPPQPDAEEMPVCGTAFQAVNCIAHN